MRITEKGQVTVPVEIRRKLGILPHSEIEFVVSGRDVLLRKMRRSGRRGSKIVSALRGRAPARMSTDEIMALTRGD